MDTSKKISNAGFSMVEMMVALTVLVVAVGLSSSSIVSISGYSRTARETGIAQSALFDQVEALKLYDFGSVFADHNGTTSDDGVGAPGPNFEVPGLNVRDGDPDGFVGRIILPEDPAQPQVLREDLVLPELDLPADLNLDGAVNADDHAQDYRLLPIRVVIEWRGDNGPASVGATAWVGPW